jgi:arylsulfatase A-like enzyme
VPFLARWPGRVPAGTVCDETISLADLLASSAALLGEPLPPAKVAAEDSVNVLPALLGQEHKRPLRRDTIVHSSDGNFAIRQGPWKWIEGKPHPQAKAAKAKARAGEFKPQLYNLAEDIGEKNNLVARNPEKAGELQKLLERYRTQGYSRP